METSATIGMVQLGGATVFPDLVYADQPVNVSAEQINMQGSSASTIYLTGSVITQITGDFVNGVNVNYPGGNVGTPAPESLD